MRACLPEFVRGFAAGAQIVAPGNDIWSAKASHLGPRPARTPCLPCLVFCGVPAQAAGGTAHTRSRLGPRPARSPELLRVAAAGPSPPPG